MDDVFQLSRSGTVENGHDSDVVDVRNYKFLRLNVYSDVDAELIIYWLVSSKNIDGPTTIFQLSAGQWSNFKVDVCANYTRVCYDNHDVGRSNYVLHVSARRLGPIESIVQKRRNSKRLSGLVVDNEKQEEEPLKIDDEPKQTFLSNPFIKRDRERKIPTKISHTECQCKTLFKDGLFLPGNLLYSRFANKIEGLPPPPNDGNDYALICRDKVPHWIKLPPKNDDNVAWF